MIEKLASVFIELLPDGLSVYGGVAQLGTCRTMLLGRRGKEALLRDDYLKALKLMNLANEAKLPIVSQLDWTEAQEQAGLNVMLKELCLCKVPIISIEPGNLVIADRRVKADVSAICEAIKELDSVAFSELHFKRQQVFQTSKGKDSALEGISIRPATENDVLPIVESFKPFVLKQQILPRSAEEIAARLDDFLVAVNKDGRIVGTVALCGFGGGLEEIRSLTVAQDCEGHGLGTRLLNEVISLAKRRQAKRVFTLTIRPHIFQRLGFFIVSLMRFPGKVQKDCLLCPKKEQCDEVALLLEI